MEPRATKSKPATKSNFLLSKRSPSLDPSITLIAMIVPIPIRAPMRTDKGKAYRAVNAIITNWVLSPNSANMENMKELQTTLPFFFSMSISILFS